MFWGVVPLEAIRDAADLIGDRTFPRYNLIEVLESSIK